MGKRSRKRMAERNIYWEGRYGWNCGERGPSSMIGIEMPALSGCIEDQELSSFKDDMLADVMELKVEKADDDVQYKTGCYETNACKWNRSILQFTLISIFRSTNICLKSYVHPMSYFVLFVH